MLNDFLEWLTVGFPNRAWYGELSSIIGLLGTIAVIIISLKVREAVRKGKEALAIELDNADCSAELRNVLSKLEVCDAHIQASNWSVASYIVAESQKELTYYMNRWQKPLMGAHSAKLKKIHFSLNSIREETILAEATPERFRPALHRILEDIKGIEAQLRQQYGRYNVSK